MTAGPGADDVAGPVRAEDAIDVEAAHRWLMDHVDALAGLPVPEVGQFPGGASNLTYLLRYPGLDLVLRRPPFGHKAASAHDMGREYRVQRQLAPWFRYVPKVLALCEDETVIGSPFYVMARVRGLIVRRQLPEGMSLAPAEARALALRAFDCLIELHRVDPVQAGLADLGRGPGYVSRQVAGWTERYWRSRTPNAPSYDDVMDWLVQRQPAESGICLIHNDFRLDNVVLDAALQVVGVLDWEMATLGDPLMDLGGALAYWVEAGDDPGLHAFKMQPSDVAGMPTRSEIVDYYCHATERTVPDWDFYEVFGLFRLAVILQQISWRYHHGETTNPAFQRYGSLVSELDARCRDRCGLATR